MGTGYWDMGVCAERHPELFHRADGALDDPMSCWPLERDALKQEFRRRLLEDGERKKVPVHGCERRVSTDVCASGRAVATKYTPLSLLGKLQMYLSYDCNFMGHWTWECSA